MCTTPLARGGVTYSGKGDMLLRMATEKNISANTKYQGALVAFMGLTVLGGVQETPWLRIALLVVAIAGLALFSGLLLRDWKRARKN
ncbi:hypothetical protein SAMN04488564_108149 [Lentzea waywayandensis]|uniref:Uncharacterized protein n=2 Tax=Lentzea waywayandensis TaxID=84724 RepID=A0A1I6F4T2_9PSEU|nr:hypothetical protein SAMN04488564_108149 [Lentzea waywayandensis]